MFLCSAWVEEGRKGCSAWRPWAAAPWTRRRAPWRREKLGSALEKGKGVERGSSTSAARAKGEETGEGGGEARSAVAARRRRGGSAANLGVRAGDGDAWRFETLPEDTRARRGLGCVADGETATPSRRETEEGDGDDGKLINNSKFQNFIL